MPIYEYECTSCHHNFDLMQKINAEPVKQCPKCFNNSVIKLVSAAGFQLKGTGWYETDFKSKKNTTNESTEKKDDSAKSTDTVTKESKAATTTTTSTASTKGDGE
jgi:putative FmdB family regulatory protein